MYLLYFLDICKYTDIYLFILLTADWVLQSWPAMVRSRRKVSLLMTSTLQVSERPSA